MAKKIVDAVRPLPFTITKDDVRKAERNNPNKCSVAQGLLATHTEYQRVHVGPKITKVVTATTITRYMTPKVLKNAIPVFDNSGVWGLPPGTYMLGAVPPSERLGQRSFRAGSWVIKERTNGTLTVKSKGGTRQVKWSGGTRRLSARTIRRVGFYA